MGVYGPTPEEWRETQRRAEERKAREAAEKERQTSLQSGGYLRDQSMAGLNSVQGRVAPQAGNTTVGQVFQGRAANIATGPQDQFRTGQLGLVNDLQGVANGTQMGAGQLAVRREGNRAIAQQQSMARMQRGGNAALAARGAAMNTGNIGLNVAGQAAQAQLADQSAARQTLAGALGQGREQDIGLATGQAGLTQGMNLANMDAQNQRVFQQAGLDQATSLANMQAKLSTMGMNDQAALAYLAQLYNVDVAEMQARLQREQIEAGKKGGSTLGGLMNVGGQILGAVAAGPVGGAIAEKILE